MYAKIPSKFHNLFWDVDVDKLNSLNHKRFIVERVLEKGNFASIKWLFQSYNLSEISDIITGTSNLSTPTVNFWRGLIQI